MVLVFSCSGIKPVLNKGTFLEQIQGDWKTKTIQSASRSRSFSFSFRDSLCAYKQPWGDFVKYKITADTLIIQKRGSASFLDSNTIYFKIKNFSQDSLQLLYISESAKDLFAKYQDFSESVTLYKIQQKNSITPLKISFYSSRCFGTCPAMALEIDSAQNILFDGRYYTEKEKGYRGKIPSGLYKNILQQIRNLPLSSLKKLYRAPWTDDQKCCLSLEYKEGIIKTCAYGQYEEPLELRILFHSLIELYKQLDLFPYTLNRNLFPTMNNQ